MAINTISTADVKGNRKGWRRSYHARRVFLLGGSMAIASLLVIVFIVMFVNNEEGGALSSSLSSSSSTTTTISKVSFFGGSCIFCFAEGAEMEVTMNGDALNDETTMAGNNLKGSSSEEDAATTAEEEEEEEELQADDGADDAALSEERRMEGGYDADDEIGTDEEEKDVEDYNDDGNTDEEEPSRLVLQTFPRITYGTAWKKDATAGLVRQAIHAGFRHIDTACQPRHYNEKGVGEGWTTAARELGLEREVFWIQTKFTSLNGQDPERVPYDKNAPLDEQVRQSLAKSLENLQTDYLDSWVMHGPEDSWEKNLLVWRTMESFVDESTVEQIGISNFYDPDAVKYLYEQARVKPSVVQNRFYRDSGYDVEIRKFCIEHDMEYQSFWTLGANRHALGNQRIRAMATEKGLTPETLMYAFVMKIGITPLDGTKNEQHMAEDMALLNRVRSGDEIFANNEELTIFAQALGIPGWTTSTL